MVHHNNHGRSNIDNYTILNLKKHTPKKEMIVETICIDYNKYNLKTTIINHHKPNGANGGNGNKRTKRYNGGLYHLSNIKNKRDRISIIFNKPQPIGKLIMFGKKTYRITR